MKFPKLPKLRLPKWTFNISIPKIFQRTDSPTSFYHVWKKFLRQIPTDSRSTISSYQHFIVLGNAKSGKTDLIQGLTDQSQDLYPFDTSITSDSDIQFYLGPTQVIQEISYASLEDRSIKIRRNTIKLWKKLYARREPIIVIAYNCFSNENQNLRELNKLGQLLAGKISLLSEITKKTLKVRIALTNLDKISGYLEFARFLKQQNLTFNINLSSNFETNTLEAALKKFFEENLTLMLTTTSSHDFAKILSFSKEMPQLFPSIEEFLRGLVSRVSFSSSLEVDLLSFTSNQESSTSFSPFQWSRLPSMEIFFRYPMLKHQLVAACLFVLLSSLMFSFYFRESKELEWAQNGINQLDLLQFNTFQEKVLPSYVSFIRKDPEGLLAYVVPNFHGEKLDATKNNLAKRIKKHFIDKESRRAVLENKGELKCLYFLGLAHASKNNHMGKFILKHSLPISDGLNISENILTAYVNSCTDYKNTPPTVNLDKVSPFIALTSFTPWLNFFTKVQEISSNPVYVEQNFEEIIKQSEPLLSAIYRLNADSHIAYGISTLLEEEKGSENSPDNIQVIRWIGENSDSLSNFIVFVKRSATMSPDNEELNISQFFAKIKKLASIGDSESQTYNFTIKDQLFSFETKNWINLVVAHNVEHALKNYITKNNNTGGAIFFKNTLEAQDSLQPIFNGPFPAFVNKITIPGRYTRAEYENKVRSTAEKLAHLVDSLAINPEDKKRFTSFLIQEVISYMKSYQNCYTKFYDSCSIQKIGIETLKSVFYELAQQSSSFHDFLQFVQHNTSAFSDPVMTLKSMNELNEFQFLNNILTQTDNQAPIREYQNVLAQILQDLEAPPSRRMDTEFHAALTPYLTPAAIASSNMLQNNSRSYKNLVAQTLSNIGVPDKFQSVFQKPVDQLYKIGLSDLKKSIEQAWSMQFQSKIETVLSKFPFNMKSSEIASVEEVNETFNPRGDFYKSLNQVMSTCCKLNDGVWRPLDPQNMQLTESIYRLINHAQSVSDLLWDKDGYQQPITIKIKSVPFMHTADENPIVVLSYLVVGDQSIRNLNQTPLWQPIKIEWWKDATCAIGIELMNKYTNSTSYKAVTKLNSKWGFFELLKDARSQNSNTVTWNLSDTDDSNKYTVSLDFENNPNELLQMQIY